jgi:hypothetical protein
MKASESKASNPSTLFRGRIPLVFLVIAILLGGFALRVYGLNWDQGYGLHPDERYITWVAASIQLPDKLSEIFDPARTGLNPYMWPPGEKDVRLTEGKAANVRSRPFSYGHLPLYLLVLSSGGDEDEARLAVVGRLLSALFDTATIALTFAVGRLLHRAGVGLLAAAFVALTVLHLQLSHYATFDTALTCFVMATVLFSVRFVRYGERRDAISAGFCLGLAIGTKFSAVLLSVPLMMAFFLRWERTAPGARRWLLSLLALSVLTTLLVFGLTNPFSMIQPRAFLENLSDQGAMLRGSDVFPFTYQYHNTRPYLYPLGQQLKWGMGIALGVTAFVGFVAAAVGTARGSFPDEMWIPLAWVLVYFGLMGSLYVKFMRYMLPVLPLLTITGARLLHSRVLRMPILTSQMPGRGRHEMWVGYGLVGLIFLLTIFYATAFLNVYRGDHPWLQLSRWIYENIPDGAVIAHEKWDHHLPLTIRQADLIRWPGEYQQFALDVYASDTPEKLRSVLEKLEKSDYLVIASNRLYGSIARWPERFPLMRLYYERLFTGQLGFHLVILPEIERHPHLGPLALMADPFRAAGLPSPLPLDRKQPASLALTLGRADESFTVYDHPRPLLFQNTGRLSATEMEANFADVLNVQPKP